MTTEIHLRDGRTGEVVDIWVIDQWGGAVPRVGEVVVVDGGRQAYVIETVVHTPHNRVVDLIGRSREPVRL